MKPKQRTIQGKELHSQISDISDYFSYEVEDILKLLAEAIAENAVQGYSTHIKGLGTFSPKKGYPLKTKSNLTGSEFEVVTRNSLSLKIDSLMSNALNGDQNG